MQKHGPVFHRRDWQFTTGNPLSEEQNVPLTQLVQVTFDEAVRCPGDNCLALVNLGQGAADRHPVVGEVSMSDAYTAVFSPAQALEESTMHVVTATGFVDQACGVPMAAPHAWTFETARIPPQVAATYPEAGATCVPTTTVVSVEFDELVQTASPLDFALAQLDPPQTVPGDSALVPTVCQWVGGLQLCFELEPSPWADGAVFTPTGSLTEGLQFEASIEGPLDAYDNALVPYAWQFGSTETVPPEVTGTEPADEDQDIYPDEAITVWFDEWLRWPSSATLVLTGPGGLPVAGQVQAASRETCPGRKPSSVKRTANQDRIAHWGY